ncbi:MAG: DUF2993 domain-containing protein [Actinobacteria bacterium]|nr:DUF2993 domain-containing protein [Actinomycetota bacterium]MCG2803299.1 DUF2993 domain-containing protein [Cellulomonas sp.]
MRKVVALVATLVVLAGLAVGADRVAVVRAEATAAQRVRQTIDVQGDLAITVHGFPFLTQLAGGRLDRVTGSADEVRFGSLTLTDVDVAATGVTTSPPVTTASADLAATIPTATLQQAARERSGLDLDVAVDAGAVTVSGDALGLTFTAAATPRVEGGRLLVDLDDVRIGGLQVTIANLPAALRDRLTGLEVPVDELPAGLVLRSAAVVDGGVRISATGTDVTW